MTTNREPVGGPGRFGRLVRKTWPFLLLVLGAAIFLGRTISPVFGLVVLLLVLLIYAYFAAVRTSD